MASSEDKIMAAVEAALKKNPGASVDDLFQLAKGVSPSVGKLSKRQFHARYPLQVKRRMNPSKPKKSAGRKNAARRGRKAAASPTSTKESVRGIILRFASDLAAADARKDVVRVVAGVDRYVDEVLKATGTAK